MSDQTDVEYSASGVGRGRNRLLSTPTTSLEDSTGRRPGNETTGGGTGQTGVTQENRYRGRSKVRDADCYDVADLVDHLRFIDRLWTEKVSGVVTVHM